MKFYLMDDYNGRTCCYEEWDKETRQTKPCGKPASIALGKLATTEKNLKKTQSDLASTQQELSDTKGERDKAVARAEAQSKVPFRFASR